MKSPGPQHLAVFWASWQQTQMINFRGYPHLIGKASIHSYLSPLTLEGATRHQADLQKV